MQDDAGTDEAERGGGDPLVRGRPCPVHAVGVGRQGTVERERQQGGEGERQGTARERAQPCGRPAFEQHRYDERCADDASADRADGSRLPVRQVAEHHVRHRAEADYEGVAKKEPVRTPGDQIHRPAAQGDEEHRLPHPDGYER